MEILSSSNLRPLWAGGVYLLLLIVTGRVVWRARHWLERKATPVALHLRLWEGWSLWGAVGGLVFTLAYLFVGLLDGIFAAGDVGLQSLELAKEGAWLLELGFALVGWMALLWGCYWKGSPPDQGENVVWEKPTWDQVILQIPSQEGRMAIVRAALIPSLGAYWGPWAAVLCIWLVSYLDPDHRARLRMPGARAFIYLGWTTNWLSTLFYVLSGSLWAALLARAAAYLPLRALSTWLNRRREEKSASAESEPG